MTGRRETRFEEVVRAVTTVGLGYLIRRCDSRDDAADVWQAVLMTAWRRIDDLPDTPEAQQAWFVGIARRELSHHRRAHARRSAATQRLATLLARLPASAPPPEISGLLDGLAEEDREIVHLTYWEGLTSDQIAAVLDLSPTAVRKRLQRSRDRMRRAIASV